ENAYDGRNFLFVDQVIENDWRAIHDAILENHYWRNFSRIILLGHINPIITSRAWKNFALIERIFGYFTLWNARLRLRIRAGRIVMWRANKGRNGENESGKKSLKVHGTACKCRPAKLSSRATSGRQKEGKTVWEQEWTS